MNKTTKSLITLGVAATAALLSLGSLCIPLLSSLPAVEQVQEGDAASGENGQASNTTVHGTEEPDDASAEQDERETYVSTWAERIDAFNAGYPLEGYGRAFAEAAYAYGVDPRYSPAIARVESGSGRTCAYAHNAWGWGAVGWSDWETAIDAQVSGLASGYGYTLTAAAAQSYNEASPDEWYAQVESCMYQIWESDSL